MRNVTLNFPEEFVDRLDSFAAERHLKRNAAIQLVFDAYQGDGVVSARAQKPIHPPTVDLKAVKLSLAKKVMGATEAHVGVAPVTLEGNEIVKGEAPAQVTPVISKRVKETPDGRFLDDSEEFKQ